MATAQNPDSVLGDFKHVQSTNSALEKRYNKLVSDKPHYTENINKVIVLRNLGGRLTAIGRLKPIENKANGELKGVLRLSDRQKEEMDYVVTKATRLEVKDGYEFDLNNTIDRLNWNWAQYSELIAPNRAAGQSSPMAQFYIEDVEAEIEQNASASQERFEAEHLVRNVWSSSKRVDMARLLGQDMNMSPDVEVLEYLVDLARKGSAKALLSMEKDQFGRERLLLLRLIDTNVIDVKGSAHYFGDKRIGLDEESTLQFMLRGENRDLVDQMQMLYNSRYQPTRSQFGVTPVRGEASEHAEKQNTYAQPFEDEQPASPALAGTAPVKSAFGFDEFKLVAPLTYERMFGKLNAAQLTYVQGNYTEAMLHKLAHQEIMGSLSQEPEQPKVRLAEARPYRPAVELPPLSDELPHPVADYDSQPSFIAARRAQAGTLQPGEQPPVHGLDLVDPYGADEPGALPSAPDGDSAFTPNTSGAGPAIEPVIEPVIEPAKASSKSNRIPRPKAVRSSAKKKAADKDSNPS